MDRRPPARQGPPFYRLVAPAADRRTDALRGVRRHPSARCVHGTGRRSQKARPQRLGQRGDGGSDLTKDLRLSPRTRVGAAEDAGTQTKRARGPDGSRGMARTGGEKPRRNSNGAAIVELLKVLLRMTSERHAVASKVIATVDDLEQIAADDQADVAALHGWRRELFGEAALALKHGRLALAIEKGRVVRVDRN